MRTIPYTIGVIALIRDLWYTVCQMKDEPHAAPYYQTFVDLHAEAKSFLLPAEISVLEAISASEADVDRADGGLDAFAGRVYRAVDDIGEAKTKKAIKTNLFKGLPLSKFRRPVLGGQLLAQTAWGSALQATNIPTLMALAPESDPLVQKGQQASKARTDAQQKNREFRDLGARKQFIDKVNAARRVAFGGLSKAPLEDPKLPSDYADWFFFGEAPAEVEETIEDVKAAITALKVELEAREKQLQEMEAEAAAAAQIEADRQAKQVTADALRKKRAELDAQIAAIEAELAKP